MPDDSGVLRPYAKFTIPADLCTSESVDDRSFRRAADLDVARRIAAGLADKGHSVSKVGPASGSGAGFYCRLNRDCEITALLGVERQEGEAIHFYLMTWQTSSLFGIVFRGGVKSSSDCVQRWSALCEAINDILLDAFQRHPGGLADQR